MTSRMIHPRLAILLFFVLISWLVPANPAVAYPLFRPPDIVLPQGMDLSGWIDSLTQASATTVAMLEPADGTLVPSDAASPIFRWEDATAPSWLITLSVDDKPVCQGVMDTPYWVPDQPLWERIKAAAGHRTIRVTVSGIASASTLISRGKTSFAVSEDPVDVPLGFLRKQLPFRKAKDAPQDSQMVVADIKSYGKPRVVLQDQPICFNCHAYSPDGKAYGMDMDYKGDKG